jgi:hypothetical protein
VNDTDPTHEEEKAESEKAAGQGADHNDDRVDVQAGAVSSDDAVSAMAGGTAGTDDVDAPSEKPENAETVSSSEDGTDDNHVAHDDDDDDDGEDDDADDINADEGMRPDEAARKKRAMRLAMKLAHCIADIVEESGADVFLYNGGIARGADLKLIETIHKNRSRNNAILLLTTNGGSPDAAYKIARYFQEKYDRFTVLISGLCKSAGTLVAVGAHELAFAPYGELGPLDIQSYKTDNLAGMESGLTINEAIEALTNQAMKKHGEHYARIITSTGRVVSFQSAAKTATDLVTGLFAPIFGRIDPYDVGQKARSMRIAMEYGKRLSAHSGNLKEPSSLDQLARSYPSHSFVINRDEASELFSNVRVLTDAERQLVDCLGVVMRDDVESMQGEPVIMCLTMKDGGTRADSDSEGDAFTDPQAAAGERADAAAVADDRHEGSASSSDASEERSSK